MSLLGSWALSDSAGYHDSGIMAREFMQSRPKAGACDFALGIIFKNFKINVITICIYSNYKIKKVG